MKSMNWKWVGIVIVFVLLMVAVVACNPETPEARSYSTACYREQGGSKWVCGTGGEMEFQSGATLDVQSGATVSLADSTIHGNLIVTGTSDLQGDMADSTGDFTIADNAIVTGTLDVQGASLQYGPNDLYPMGVSSSGFQMVWGTDTITNSATVAHGLTSPAAGWCTYSGTLTDNEEQKCSVNISGATVTIYTYKEDGTAGDSGVAIYWMVIGTP